MTPILLSGPAIEPVSVAEAKAWLRVELSEEDALISTLITSARLVLEAYTRLLFIEQSWKIVYDIWPEGHRIHIPLAPFISLDALNFYDSAGEPVVVPPADYMVDPAPQCARILFKTAPPQPGRTEAGIELRVKAGFGLARTDVPAPLRQALMMLVARWFENRGDVAADATILPDAIAPLVVPYRRVKLG
jgi:uncharacterized phiE125 gp8 family phage protein